MAASGIQIRNSDKRMEKVGKAYEELISNHEDFFPHKSTFIDCGAGSGLFSLLCISVLKAERVYAYEGYYRNFSLLLDNITENSAFNVTADDHHIMGDTGREWLNVESGVVNSLGIGEKILVETRKLDDLTLPGAGFINIAVPGPAKGIIMGGRRRIGKEQPSMMVEIMSGKEEREVRKIVEELGLAHEFTETIQRLEGAESRILFFSGK